MSVEMRSGILGAQEWVDAGKPPLQNASYVYGVSGLKLSVISQTAEGEVIEASYLKWQPDFPGDTTTTGSAAGSGSASGSNPIVVKSVAYQTTERLHLKLDGKDWVIYQIDQISSKLVPSDTVESTTS